MDDLKTLILAGIGAFIASFAAKFVEGIVRKNQIDEAQRDADLQDLIASVRALGEICEKFWCNSATDLGQDEQILRAHIMAQQHNVAELVATLFHGRSKWDCDMRVVRFFNAASGGDFGEPDRAPDPGRLTEILIAMHALIHEVKQARRKIKRSFLT